MLNAREQGHLLPTPHCSTKVRGTVLWDRDHHPDVHLSEQRMRCSPPNLWWPLCDPYASAKKTLSIVTMPHFLHYPAEMHLI